ncbi:MAG: UvrD-helicase domain-containing protein [Myxococcota bacterium]
MTLAGQSLSTLPMLVEASAGTGKTHAITTYFVQALLELDLRAEQILVVTYTKAATAELRIRTRQRIAEAFTLADSGAKTKDDLEPAISQAVTRLGRDEVRARLRQALYDLDRAPIFTIHGFCQRLLQDHPLLFGVEVDFEVAEDSFSVFYDLAIDFWTTELHESPLWFIDALRKRRIDPEFLGRLAGATLDPTVELLGPAYAELDAGSLEEATTALRETGLVWEAGRDAISQALLDHAGLNRNRYPRGSIQSKWLPELDSIFAKGSLELPDWFEKLGARRMVVKKGHGPPRHAFFEACDRLIDHVERVRLAVDSAVFRFLERFVERARSEATRRAHVDAVLTYDDLLTTVYKGLDAKAAAKVQQTFPFALVDEFQDTDSVQYGIFRRIYGEHAAVYVGDPKQAIYSFRGADVFSYLAASDDIQERRRELTVNRRSDPGMIAAVEALFTNSPSPFAIDGIKFPQVTAHHASRSSLDPSIEVVMLDREVAKARAVEESVPPIVANEVALLLESGETIGGRPITPSDIAILCRTNRQALRVTEALRRLELPVSLDGDASVLGTFTADDVETVLQAALTPADASAIRRALLTDLVGMLPEQLQGLGNDEWSTWISRFRSWHDAWHEAGVTRFFEDFLRTTEAEKRLATRSTATRRLTDLLHIQELLLRGERARGRDPVALVLWFRRLRQGSPEDKSVAYEDLQQRPDADGNTIRVTTVHKSKGLEYGVVYCPFLWRDAMLFDFDRRVVKFHDPEDGHRAKCDLGSERLNQHLELRRDEALSEALRLLYVGVTRAKHRCTLFWGLAREWRKSSFAYLLHGATLPKTITDEEVHASLEALAASSQGTLGWTKPARNRAWSKPAPPPDRNLEASEARRVFDPSHRIASFTSLTGHHAKTTARRSDEASTESTRALFGELPGGARTGLLLHSLLERAPLDALQSADALRVVEAELRAYGYEPSVGDRVLEDLRTVVQSPLFEARQSPTLSAIPRDRQLRELAFTLDSGRPDFGELAALLESHRAPASTADYPDLLRREPPRILRKFLRGFIDLVFEWEGRWYVADYKSNVLPRYDQASMADAAAQSHYVLQVLLYSVATHRYLGQRLPGYDPETNWGGAMLLFVRGMHGDGGGVYFDPMSPALITAADRWLGGIA